MLVLYMYYIRHLGLESEFKEIGKNLRKFRSFKKGISISSRGTCFNRPVLDGIHTKNMILIH